jgi:membrane associated rhomboid family serine protease
MTPWVKRLLFANIGVYFLQQTVPGVTNALDFVPVLVLMRPWTIVTYMFLHGGLTHILFNMIGLYFFGPRVEGQLGSPRFITLYLISGIAGAMLSFFLAPQFPIIGASAAIYGVMLAYAMFWPYDEILLWFVIPIQIRWLVIGVTAISLFSGFGGSSDGTAHFAHLGGFAGAFLYMRWLESRRGMVRFKKAAVTKVPDRTLSNWSKVDPKSVHEVNRDEVNRILDKINATGIGSLTPQEKVFLAHFVPLDDRMPPVA